MSVYKSEDCRLAQRVFDMMTWEQRMRVLKDFADLEYPSLADRLCEAVYREVVRPTPHAEPHP